MPFQIKIKVDIKWNVKTEWVNISKISPFLNSFQLNLFSKCGMKAISSFFYLDWCHGTFILWPIICQQFWPVLDWLFCDGVLQNHFSQCLDIVLPPGETACSCMLTEQKFSTWWNTVSSVENACLVEMSTLEKNSVTILPEPIIFHLTKKYYMHIFFCLALVKMLSSAFISMTKCLVMHCYPF